MVVGMTQVCSMPMFSQDTIAKADFNCDKLGQWVPSGGVQYRPTMDPQPQSFTKTRAFQQSEGRALTFTRQCDGYVDDETSKS